MIKLTDILKEIIEEEEIDFSSFNFVDDEVENELEKISQQQNEVILTAASIALAAPGIINSLIKAGKAVAKKRGIDLAKSDPNAWYNVLEKWTEKIDKYIEKPFDILLKPFISDNTKRQKAVDIVKALSLATLATVGAADISKSKAAYEYGSRLAGPAWNEIVKAVGDSNKLINVAKHLLSSIV
jgi:hypothetical protein